MRVATYNIHRCIGTDGKRDVGRVAAVIAELGADVVGLQEVDSRPALGTRDQAQVIAARLGMELLEGPLMHEPGGHYGNAVLSRLPLELVARGVFAPGGFEPRGYLHVAVADGGTAPWQVVVTHLDLVARHRSRQLEELAAKVAGLPPTPALLMGDLNEWRPWARNLVRLAGTIRLAPGRKSFPSRKPLLALDRIAFLRCRVTHGPVVHRSPLSRRASDHLPVWLEAAAAPAAADAAPVERPSVAAS